MPKTNHRPIQDLEAPDLKQDPALTDGTNASLPARGLGPSGPLSVTEEVELVVSPARTWAVIKDFQSWQSWHPAFAATEITRGAGNARGTVRVLETPDGARFTEELLSHDAASRSYQYRIIESPLPISGYVSKIEVKEAGAGSRVVWSSGFTVNAGASDREMKETIAGVYRAGLDSLKAALN